MRFVVKSNRVRCLKQAAAIGLIAIFGTGCSTDFSRFDPEQFKTASVNENQYQQQPAISQTQNADQYPNDQYQVSSAQQANTYPDDVDPVTTASISRPNTRRSAVSRPPLPGGIVSANQPNSTPVTPQYSQNAPVSLYDSRQRTGQVAPLSNGVNPYPADTREAANTYQKPVHQAANASRSVTAPLSVDPITTASIRPAKPALVPNNNRRSQSSTGWTSIGGTAITMRQGETLYNISKRYGVPVKEIVKANNLSSPDQVRDGQRIVIPTYVYSSKAPVSAPDRNPKTKASRASTGLIGEKSSVKSVVPLKTPDKIKPGLAAVKLNKRNTANKSGDYLVVAGDSLGKIANKNGVSVSDLKRINNLTSSNIRIGQKLKMPGKTAEISVKSDRVPKKVAGLAPMKVDPVITNATPKPYTKPNSVDPIRPNASEEKAPARTGIENFRWPATGKVVSKFGDRRNGERNSGIDISVPEGTSVKAAENGVVIYSGNELKDYGNLLLIRHDGGWVSAYAYNKSLQVKRGERVRRGQVVAKSGRTGKAEQPMIHFELRKDSNPVNPQTYLR